LGNEEEGVDFSAFKNNEYKNLALLMTWFVDAGWYSGKKEAGTTKIINPQWPSKKWDSIDQQRYYFEGFQREGGR
jgi:hypothetical protein